MFGRFGLGELIVILLIALVVFGPQKLPEIGKSLGEAIRQFKISAADVEDAVNAPAAKEKAKETGTGSDDSQK